MTQQTEALKAFEEIVAEAADNGNSLEPGAWLTEKSAVVRAAISSQPPAPSWQPIETAPMDKFVLCAVEFDGPGDWRIKIGEYRTNEDRWHVLGGTWSPTRWMPLPAAPASLTATAGSTP